MTRLEIRSLHSPDVEVDAWEPADDREVHFLLELEIGEVGDERADLFQVVVASPEGLRARKAHGGVLSDRATLVLSRFSWTTVHGALARIIKSCEADDWAEAVQRLQRYFAWEYEDYVQE